MEKEIILFFHNTIANKFLDSLMLFFTQRGFILWLPIFLWMCFTEYRRKEYLQLLYLLIGLILGVFIADWIGLEIKNLVQRARPCDMESFRPIVGCRDSYSFPSNHVTNAFCVGMIFFLFLKKYPLTMRLKYIISFYILLITFSISISRIYLAVHWPSDILGGAILGSVIGITVFQTIIRVNSLKRAFYFFLVVFSLFRIYFILHGPVDISPDEAHYWEWSRRLDWSYYSKGPMIAWLIAVSTSMLGDTPIGIRFFAVVFSFLSSIFIYKIGKHFISERAGYIGGIIFQLLPLFSIYGVIFTIDSPYIFLWTVSMYFFLKGYGGNQKYWLLAGVTVGAGLLTKYTMAFFYLCGLIYLFIRHRFSIKETLNYLKNPWLIGGVIISFVLFLPVIFWNFQHDFVTFKHTAGQAHLYDGLKISLRYFGEFIGSQIIVFTPLLFFIGFYLILHKRALNISEDKRWFLISFSLPIFFFFLIKSIQGKVQANWAMTSYVPFILAASIALERKILKKLMITSVIIGALLTLLTYAMPFFKLPANLDPSARLKGWQQLGEYVSKVKETMERDGRIVIFSDRYQIASELAFYIKYNPYVYCINLGRRMNQYDLWSSMNDELKIRTKVNGVFVTYGSKNEPPEEVKMAFAHCVRESFTAQVKGVKIRDYTIFKCLDFKGIKERKPESY